MPQNGRNSDTGKIVRVAGHAAKLCLFILCSAELPAVSGGSKAVAQETMGPSQDSPALRAGLRVERPFGALEISTFTRTQKDQDTEFKIEFLIRNESSGVAYIRLADFRVIGDGVPRAPMAQSGGCCDVKVEHDSAEYAWATFQVRGQPKVVYLLIGSREEGRSYFRWPE